MSNDEFKKVQDFFARELQNCLGGFIGERLDKDSLDGVKAEVEKVLDKIAKTHKVIVSDVEVVGDTVRYKITQPDGIRAVMLPTIEGPFTPWHEDGLVHLAGRLGDYEVRACDYVRLGPGGFGCSWMVTCLACLTFLPPGSNTVTVMSAGTTV